MRSMSCSWRWIASVGLGLAVCSSAPVATALAQGGAPPSRQSRGGSSSRSDRGRAIEAELQHRIGVMMRERLGLTEEQVKRLESVTVKLERERRQVRGEEFRLRMGLRSQLLAGDLASNDTVAMLLDRMPEIERRKIDLMAAEQRELAQFLTPIQRARYLALQDEIRRNMEQIRNRRSSSDGKPGDDKSGSGGRPPGDQPY